MIGHAEPLRLAAGASQLMLGMVAAIIKGEGAHHLMVAMRPVKSCSRIQPAGE
jgi:hypothetical protein